MKIKLLATVAAAVTLSGCAVGGESADAGAAYPSKALSIMAPGSPGGGWDTRARGIASALSECEVADVDATVTNVPGAGGTIGLAQFAKHKGDPYQLMVMDSVTMLGGIVSNKSPVDLSELTPVAGLSRGPSAIVVPVKSPYKDLKALLDAMEAKPRSVKWTGGSLGGPGQMTVAGLAKERGVAAKEINFVPTAGGGESMNLLLSGAATAGIDTVAELRAQIEAGELRALSVDSEQRVPGLDAPTMKELGLGDEAVSTLAGVLAPAGLTKEQQQEVIGLLDKVRKTSCWKKDLERNNWTEDWKPGDEFGKVLAEQRTQVTAILGDLGLGK
ncbi:Bug family tripartite tricarboxylate transporter substrate binding protein [Nonomuraea diastatica]|uniref:Tripartite tricarboxylate transporter substrate binding protein n=1 Tax=Nonomuraea diastatica TaxID=1848329 RepID=A0A4R4WYE4_9ACTN|nr:tripartite tricarboxylate transporter substrate binding protein [Nonomuraea diastatica]TDD22866.1 tripartite tricarboxylate transporter substrate binding protein [Nonomuraea diastatica]